MNITGLAQTLEISIDSLLVAMYALIRSDPHEAPMTIINPGVRSDELDDTERRIHHSLHPTHRTLLGLSNGGTLPFVNSLGFFAAARQKEDEWNWLVAPEPSSTPAVDQGAGFGPFKPFIMGQSIASCFDPKTAAKLDLDRFIAITDGYDGEFFGYSHTDPLRIEAVSQDVGRYVAAADFGTFIGDQLLLGRCATEGFIRRIRAFVRPQ